MNALSRVFWRPGPSPATASSASRNLSQLIAKPFRFGKQPQSQPQPRSTQIRHDSTKTPGQAKLPSQPQPAKPSPPKEDPIPSSSNVAPLPIWERLGPFTWAAHSYGRAQRRRPYVTQLCSSLVIAFCADASVQRMNHGPYDPKRTTRSLIIGGISSIPSYNWFLWLAQNFNYSSRILSLLTKVAVNQVFFTPIFNTYFFGMQAMLAGEGLRASWNRVCQTVPTSVVNSLKVWPAVTAINFTFIPLEYRSIFAGVFAVGWQTYLMFLNRKAEDAKAAASGSAVVPIQAGVTEVSASPAAALALAPSKP
ncbi:mpv17 pmp22 family protein [Ophiostoma piceae UAMH 11346]|uniref:Mpv17 pmp22 family protein n=1 Tax=Ophiostoma piceae (strain UAMH 11346) TaxID=1262450 RepID=S3D035_OPHP1|nr:mpv17 pmp22 family protein [Ophiostoma piceae UAMH 11346]